MLGNETAQCEANVHPHNYPGAQPLAMPVCVRMTPQRATALQLFLAALQSFPATAASSSCNGAVSLTGISIQAKGCGPGCCASPCFPLATSSSTSSPPPTATAPLRRSCTSEHRNICQILVIAYCSQCTPVSFHNKRPGHEMYPIAICDCDILPSFLPTG